MHLRKKKGIPPGYQLQYFSVDLRAFAVTKTPALLRGGVIFQLTQVQRS